jgi:hypothetical protein
MGSLPLLSVGCSLYTQACRNIAAQVTVCKNEIQEEKRNEIVAREVWETCFDATLHSKDYACGFQAGFVDFLVSGLPNDWTYPPRRYWSVRYETPEGAQAVSDWLTGFHDGNVAAQASGYRRWVVFPPPSPQIREVPPLVESLPPVAAPAVLPLAPAAPVVVPALPAPTANDKNAK